MARSDALADPDDVRSRRNVRVLVLAQALLGAQLPVHFILGGLAGQMLASNKCLSTLPISMIVFGSMATAPVMAGFMQRRGRRPGFVVGCLAGALGAGLCAAGLWLGSFGLFLLGSLAVGIYMCGNGFYRFAAADGASDTWRPRAISAVMAAGLVSALIGPQVVKTTADLLAPVPFAGAYLAVVAINLAGLGLFVFLDSPPPPEPHADAPPIRSRLDLLRTPRIAVAILVATVAYSLMNLVMTATPLAMVGCGFATAQTADVIGGHVLAMFAPAFFTGRLIDRFGVLPVTATGLGILAGAGLAGLAGVDLANFYLALLLLGLGWNFGFIGATTLLTSAYRPEERGRVQGMNDFIVFGCVGLTSLASGGLMNCSGGSPAEGWVSVNLAMIPFLVAAFGALVWLVLSERRRPA
ncbi:MFS transporter [Amaricoccus sp.]|uniref:MFS transporter n=1 Tax=Amaricoccus sp. TaxID=1872485 RepID=UPI001B440BE0|nr:MFS transporter [Amaricoccus sp.]MBP7241421.1 MFS transporter [Amaricoccus sp.]